MQGAVTAEAAAAVGELADTRSRERTSLQMSGSWLARRSGSEPDRTRLDGADGASHYPCAGSTDWQGVWEHKVRRNNGWASQHGDRGCARQAAQPGTVEPPRCEAQTLAADHFEAKSQRSDARRKHPSLRIRSRNGEEARARQRVLIDPGRTHKHPTDWAVRPKHPQRWKA